MELPVSGINTTIWNSCPAMAHPAHQNLKG
jgi:hypothetical protein